MKNQALSTMLASAMILGSSMVGCSGATMDRRPALRADQAPKLAPRVEKALEAKDYARALMQAEQLVAAAPDDATYRVLLGRAYLANGRYESARTALKDAMTLGDRGTRTIVSLALAETALDNAPVARALLAEQIASLPAADYGLAMAMAGDPREGARALLEAARQPGATAQTRQNLAYALALAGSWGQARLIAGQDLPAREADARIGQWSQSTRGGDARSRVIAMIGVAPRGDDAGLPAQLALGASTSTVRTASADDLVEQAREEVIAQAEFGVPSELDAQGGTAGSALVAVAQAEPLAEVPVIRAAQDPMHVVARAAFRRAGTKVAPAPAVRTVSVAASGPQGSDWVVQLGAYNSAAVARTSWQTISRSAPAVAGYAHIHSQVALGGRAYHRLAIRGFADRKAADSFCQSLRAGSQGCFVRRDDTAGAHMAAR